MTVVVGYAPDGRARAVLHLAAMLARSGDEELVLCAVLPRPWPPSPARVDAEYLAELERIAQAVLEQARERLPRDVAVRTVVHSSRSAPGGLLDVAEQHDATLIVAGSSPSGGPGHVALGSVTARLLHSSPIPVALAPRGFRCGPKARVARVTAAFGGADDELVVAAAGVAARVGASLRVASFAVRPRAPFTAGVGQSADDQIIASWTREIAAEARAALDAVGDLPSAPHELSCEIGHGETWEEALEDVAWEEGDVLVVGSSATGPIARVFLGSRASKIVRNSPVPVAVLPRGSVAEIADEARASSPSA